MGAVLRFFSSLFFFDYARFIWASRSTLAGIIALLLSSFFSNAALWLTSSAVICLQLYFYGERFSTKSKIFIWSCVVVFGSATLAMFTDALWVLWVATIGFMSLAYYFGYPGPDRAAFWLWSAILVVINLFFPIHGLQWTERITFLFIGTLIAYAVLLVKIPVRKQDKITTQLSEFVSIFQHFTTRVFQKLIFEEEPLQYKQDHDHVVDALTHLQHLSKILPLTYNLGSPTIKQLLTAYFSAYQQIFFYLVTIEQLPKVSFSTEMKLCLEHLHTIIQSLSNGFFETVDKEKTMTSMHYLFSKIKDEAKKNEITAFQWMRISTLNALLKELIHEFEVLATFLDGAIARNGLNILQRMDI